MAFVALTDDEIASGKAISNPLTEKIKENFDNHESRIDDLETGNNTVYPPIIFRVAGNYSLLETPFTNVLKTTINFNLTVTGVRILIDTAGSAGSTSIDLKYRRSGGSYTSILTTPPSCNYQDGDDFFSAASANGSVAAVINAGQASLLAGDILRLDLTSKQTDAKSFLVRIDYVKD